MFDLKIFNGIEPSFVSKILVSAQREKFKKWDIIFKEWEKDTWKAYIINSWEVEVIMNWQVIAKLIKWDMFWEMALLSEENRSATVQSLSDLELIIITLSDLIELVNNDDNIINKQIIKRIEENLKLLD